MSFSRVPKSCTNLHKDVNTSTPMKRPQRGQRHAVVRKGLIGAAWVPVVQLRIPWTRGRTYDAIRLSKNILLSAREIRRNYFALCNSKNYSHAWRLREFTIASDASPLKRRKERPVSSIHREKRRTCAAHRRLRDFSRLSSRRCNHLFIASTRANCCYYWRDDRRHRFIL